MVGNGNTGGGEQRGSGSGASGVSRSGKLRAHVRGGAQRGAERDDVSVNKPVVALKKPRSSSDLFGAFCFVVLVLTVLYAALTIE